MWDGSVERCEKNVKIFVRILPLERPCDSCAEISEDRKTLLVRSSQAVRDQSSTGERPVYWTTFRTDGIFHEASQLKVYRATASDFIEKYREEICATFAKVHYYSKSENDRRVLGGVNCVMIVYGQTGSGKSFTVSGLKRDRTHRGIVARLLTDLLAEKANRRRINDIRCRLSFIELRGKSMTDLLAAQKRKLNVNHTLKSVTAVDVESETETLRRLFEGEARRSIVKGATHPVSHLGTAVITFHVSNVSLIESQAVVATAKIHIVEMAGVGTVGKSGCPKAAADVGMANLMRMQLEQYFTYLREPMRHVSKRNVARSNLLRVLRDGLTVTSIIRFISHVRITREDHPITLSTMRLTAEVARLRAIRTKRHIQPRTELMLRQLREEVSALKEELDLNEMFQRQEALANISKLRLEQMGRDVVSYLKGSISELTLFNVTQTRVLLKIVKQLYKLLANEVGAEELSEACEDAVNALADGDLFATWLKKTRSTAGVYRVSEENGIASEVLFNDVSGEKLAKRVAARDEEHEKEGLLVAIRRIIDFNNALTT